MMNSLYKLLYKINWRILLFLDKISGKEPYLPWYEIFTIIIPKIFYKMESTEKSFFGKIYEASDGFYRIELPEFTFFWPREYKVESILKDLIILEQKSPFNYFSWNPLSYGDIVIDIGGCEGYFSHKCLNIAQKIYIFEPVPRFAEALRKTFFRETENNKVNILKIALSDQSGLSNFYISKSCPSGGTLEELSNQKSENNFSSIKVRKDTLDKFSDKYNIDKIDLVKIDVEGSELAVLHGMKNIIKYKKPKMLICTYHYPSQFREVKEFIEKFDYEIHYSKCVRISDYNKPAWRPALIYATPK